MRSGRQRVVLLALAVVVAVGAFVVARSGSNGNDNEKTSGRATIEVKNAQPVGGVQDLTWKKGETIDLTVRSDTADEVHFHGYDVHKDVAKGGSVRFQIPATITGKFIVELEEHKQTLANVTVTQ
jgi:hypothetical protein